MADLPTLCLLLLTAATSPERAQYAERTLRSALDNLRYSGRLSVHIADDGSPPEHRGLMAEIAGGYGQVQGVSLTDAEHGGYGRNYNLATQAVHPHAPLILPLEDDWELVRELDLDPLAETLLTDIAGCLRLGYLGWTQELRGSLAHSPAGLLLLFDPESPEPHAWAGHPRLETCAWQQRVGPWTEGLNPGATEFDVCQRRAAREGVAWPMDLIRGYGDLWAHIGTVQARDDQGGIR